MRLHDELTHPTSGGAGKPMDADAPPEADVMRELREMKAMLKTLLDSRAAESVYLDARTLAQRLGISVTTLYREVARDKLPAPEKFGASSRWKWAAVEDALAREAQKK